ncbi:NAD(+) diphosphatase [Solirubrobacter phytolaccae]|uniref:NAD(+) diphosphatase n=1 Tax=Solirubrobacter phytolaccae TaxID=1404360 RepID=A0A9X3SB69_9ACTN|nr:NAD(+) diphosphatase [Solirubrobacter phytolaccae]MDA0184428.1 NAD(+) diphosphatase [Solirubrobacter phytolaccae]
MQNAFTGAALDRVGDSRRRDEAWVAAQLKHRHARAVVAGDRGLRLADGRLELVPLIELEGGQTPLLLGVDDVGPVFAFDEDPPRDGRVPMVGSGGVRGEPPVDASGDRVPLRQAVARLSQQDGGLAAYAAALLNWHRRHRYCSACGQPSDLTEGGLTRVCPNCGAEHHPRTDPVVIMLVTDGDQLLLGRQAVWPTGRYSALAGFVEPGESLEEAVAREVLEEAGVRVGAVTYLSSQPWPFPASLMLGFTATYESGVANVGDEELEDVRWFTRAEVEAAALEPDSENWGAAGGPPGTLALPPRLAIARRLIEHWLAH